MRKDIQQFLISDKSTIIDALKTIDMGGEGFAVIVGESLKFEGLITDGDVRRALINGANLNSKLSSHVQRNCVIVRETAKRADVIDLMKARVIRQIPVIGADGTLEGVHLLHEIIGCASRSNWALIMAGGKGTRLRPITENIPKPMVKVAGRPIIERIVLHLLSYGITQIYVAVNYLGHIIEDYLGDGEQFGCSIEYLHEDEPLGTGGALSLLPTAPENPILVMNGDLVMQTDLDAMLRFHDKGSYYATMGLRPYTHEVAFGCAEVEDEKIKSIEEKPILQKMVNAGIYVLSPEAIQDVPASQSFPITTLFENALNTERDCGAYVMEEEWADIGNPHQLRKANGLA